MGIGLDLRAGYTIQVDAMDTVNASIEVTPGMYTQVDDGDAYYPRRALGISVVVGYQML